MINSFLNLYKPVGPTSMEMVRQIKRITGLKRRVGHTGTLDPMAEGVLPICIGQATRLMEYLIEGEREYHLEVELGTTTSTYDREGEVVKRGDASGVTPRIVEDALKSFVGRFDQIPPMHSALKVDGKRLYELARAGVEVERKPRKVEISDIQVLELALPSLVFKVNSGRGAYMRSLAHDLGEVLGCGGYLKRLVRLRSGPFRVEEAIHMDALDGADGAGSWKRHLLPPDFVLLDMKSVAVGKAAERYIRNGQSVNLAAHVGAYAGYMERYRSYTHDGRFLAVLCFDKLRNRWQPHKVFSLDTPSPYAPAAGAL